ncbi:hypothetical protein [Vibrio harveyi]|uniref:hypothetical protein n=1 Tax=Vibrio harveyi TaxID=669 RepID=UPI000B16A67E|nr:hypothetical protein [Vibrio harveyi]
MNDSRNLNTSKTHLKKVLGWLAIGTFCVVITSIYGGGLKNNISLFLLIGVSTVISLLLPLPIIIISWLFQSKRNIISTANTFCRVQMVILTLVIVGSSSIMINKYNRSQAESLLLQTHKTQSTPEAKKAIENDVTVIHSKELDEELHGIEVDMNIVDALEKSYHDSVNKILEAQFKNDGYSTKALPQLTGRKVSMFNLYEIPVGAVTVTEKSLSSDGYVHTKRIYAVGIIDSALHTVVCQTTGDIEISLFQSPKCREKLDSVFGAL